MSTRLERESLKRFETNVVSLKRAIKNLNQFYMESENFVEVARCQKDLMQYLKEEEVALEEKRLELGCAMVNGKMVKYPVIN